MDKRELIRKNAIKVIAQEGYHNTKVQMIANQAGVAVGTVYNYFANKEELLNYIFEVEFDKRLRLLQSLKKDKLPFKEKLATFLEKHFIELESYPDTTAVLIQEGQLPQKHSLVAVSNFMDKLPELLAEMIDEAKEDEEIREVNSILVANAIFHGIRGMASKVAVDDSYSFVEAKEELIDLLWSGIQR